MQIHFHRSADEAKRMQSPSERQPNEPHTNTMKE